MSFIDQTILSRLSCKTDLDKCPEDQTWLDPYTAWGTMRESKEDGIAYEDHLTLNQPPDQAKPTILHQIVIKVNDQTLNPTTVTWIN